MMSPKRDPYQDSDKHWPFLQEFARVLYEKNSLLSVSLALLMFWSGPVSKFEQYPGGYNVEQIKT